MTTEFDYVIVGAGAAGSVMAYRLSQAGHGVCVLEAGPVDSSPFIHLPAGFMKTLANPKYTWPFMAEASEWTGGRRTSAVQGRTLGGSGSINGMVFVRGQRGDYDTWRQKGNRGWSYEDVLPYFKRFEYRIGTADENYRGRHGRLPVTDNDWIDPLCEAFIAGAHRLGYPRGYDYNGATQHGVGYFQRAINGFRRVSAARAFLYPAMKTGRVDVRTEAQASAILFEGRRAIGVRYRRGGRDEQVLAGKEVIVSSGGINSAKLLQLSGLGPAELLQQHGIEVVRDIAGVGENLSDHYSARIVARAKNVRTINNKVRGLPLLGEIAKWAMRRPSILSLSVGLVNAFGMSEPGMEDPDFTVVFSPGSYQKGSFEKLEEYPGMTCGAWQQRPESLGYVRIRSSNPAEDPEIQPRYLSAMRDRQVLLAGLRAARAILATPEMAPYYERENLPGREVQTDDEMLDFIKQCGVSAFHFVGTCRMGPAEERTTVVDDNLRVRGVERLRVADSSIMPTMVSANTYATSLMIGEKASDMILGKAEATAQAA